MLRFIVEMFAVDVVMVEPSSVEKNPWFIFIVDMAAVEMTAVSHNSVVIEFVLIVIVETSSVEIYAVSPFNVVNTIFEAVNVLVAIIDDVFIRNNSALMVSVLVGSCPSELIVEIDSE